MTTRKPGIKISEYFSFEHDGETYKFEGSLAEVTKPGFIRKMRKADEVDLLFTMFEMIAGDEALEVIDSMSTDEFKTLVEDFGEAMQAYQGTDLGN